MLKNISLVNVNWKIKNIEELTNSNFEIEKFQGVLKVNQQQEINVKFKAVESIKIEKILSVEISDTENRNIKS